MVKSLLIVAFMIISLNINATEFFLSTMSNDMDTSETYGLSVDSDGNEELVNMHTDTVKNGEFVNRQSFELSKLADGHVLMKEQGMDIITISSDNFAPHNGGHIQIKYLYNGINRQYKTLTIELVSEGDSWSLYDYNQLKIKKMHFKAKKVLGKVVGIDKIIITN